MSRTTLLTYPLLHLLDQLLRELFAGFHEQEKQYGFIGVVWASLTHANAVLDVVWEKGFDDIVDFCAAEADARGVKHAVGTAEEVDATGLGVD